jgi:hypothetical protein
VRCISCKVGFQTRCQPKVGKEKQKSTCYGIFYKIMNFIPFKVSTLYDVKHLPWSATSLRVLVPGFASTASKICGSTFTTHWERSLRRFSDLGWNFLVSLKRCTVKVNVFELGTTLSGNCSRYSICAWITLPPVAPYASIISVNPTFIKFGILNDLITNTRLSILCYTARFVELQLITDLCQPNLR